MTDGPIERYLDDLFVELRRTSPRDARSLLSETESHLRDAADEAMCKGMSATDAENYAIGRFGGARNVAAADRNRGRGDLVRSIIVSAWALGALGAIAVGVSGLIAGLMRLAGASNEFVAGSRSTANLSPSDCARWLSGYPHALSCGQAALEDWAWETVGYRIAFGAFGLLALGSFLFVRRRWSRVRGWAPLPSTVVDTIATTLFVAGSMWLAGLGIDALIVNSGRGAGQWLSAAPVALAIGLVFGFRLVRDLSPGTS
ncbi:MAG: hypothetical protein M3Z84_09465 [Actinomycetota bacterium]|nr:hypothetical protein [Actinomycetota bacterium]